MDLKFYQGVIMATSGLLALIDDIATLLDDVALLTKAAATKTAGVLGDDLALNAEQVAGVRAERELPVVWAVAKGSARNKLILVPVALLLSAFAPQMITPLLMIGGAYLCFEGFEKIVHKLLHSKASIESEQQQLMEALIDPNIDLAEFERTKIRGAIRTDFILSAEIVVIALGTVQGSSITQQIVVVTLIAAGLTVGVYGVVAGIVKLDDAGLYLIRSAGNSLIVRLRQWFGRMLLGFCPHLMKILSVAGTIAMFLVGGGILLHGMPGAHEVLHHLDGWMASIPVIKETPEGITSVLVNTLAGVLGGGITVFCVTITKRLLPSGSNG